MFDIILQCSCKSLRFSRFYTNRSSFVKYNSFYSNKWLKCFRRAIINSDLKRTVNILNKTNTVTSENVAPRRLFHPTMYHWQCWICLNLRLRTYSSKGVETTINIEKDRRTYFQHVGIKLSNIIFDREPTYLIVNSSFLCYFISQVIKNCIVLLVVN